MSREQKKEQPPENLKEIVASYNTSLTDEDERYNFREKYMYTRMGTTNAMERRRDSRIKPIVETATAGDCQAIEISPNRFAVLPLFDKFLSESNVKLGALGEFFNIPGFNVGPKHDNKYSIVKIIRPAIFEKTTDDKWNLLEQGEIDIGAEAAGKTNKPAPSPPQEKKMPQAQEEDDSMAGLSEEGKTAVRAGWEEGKRRAKERGLSEADQKNIDYINSFRQKEAGEAAKGSFGEKETEEKEKNKYEVPRKGTEITLSRINNYDELWAETKQAGDKIFRQKTRALWKDFAVHGVMGKDNEGKPKLLNFTDLDGKCSLGLLKLAGIKTGNLKYVNQGEHIEGGINLDTGNRQGVILEDGGKTAFIDHHSDASGRDSSATKFTYELLTSLGLLKKEEYLDKLVEFVTQTDNKNFPDEEKYFKDSWRTVLGLDQFLEFKNLADYFKEGRQPTEILTEKDIRKIGAERLAQKSEQQKEKVGKSLAELKRMEENGLVVDSERYGKIAVDIDKKIPAGFDAVRAGGYSVYIIWSPREKSFFISSVEPLEENFSQGTNIRGNMWIKPRHDDAPLKITLKEILTALTDGQFQPTGELADFIKKEGGEVSGEKKAELPLEIREILVSAVIEFRQRLMIEVEELAGWKNYKPGEQKTLLGIETRSFLRGLVSEQLVAKKLLSSENAEEFIESLLKQIM